MKYRFYLFVSLLMLAVNAYSHERPEGYYKHLFMDGGVSLTSRAYFPAGNHLADSLGYNFEFVATTSEERTVRVIAGNPENNLNVAYPPDDNGYLLYPDGSPRFTMVYVNGGTSTDHGIALTEKGRQNFRDFVKNGGSYIGTCAGTFLASLYNTSKGTLHQPYPFYGYFHIWPAYLTYSGMSSTSHGMTLEDLDTATPGIQNPLLQYTNFGGDNHVDWVRHNNGPYFPTNQTIPPGTEILARFDLVGNVNHGRVCLIAYKLDSMTGRVVLNASHPEGDSGGLFPISTGDRYDLFNSKIQYAAAGLGVKRVKGELRNHIPRIMSDNNMAGFEKIGDYQYHHFKVNVPESSPFLKVELEGAVGYPFNLYARRGGLALNSVVASANKDRSRASTKSMTIDLPESGEWFVGVELDTSVIDSQGANHPIYKGAVAVLNGIAYTIKASFNNTLPAQYVINAFSGAHGSIVPSGAVEVLEGGRQPFKMVPDSAYEVDYVTVNGEKYDAVDTYVFENIVSDGSIDVQFRERVYYDTLIVDNGRPGTSFTGSWANSGSGNYYGTQSIYTGRTIVPEGSYTWAAPVVPGDYSVEMWWTTATSRIASVAVVIKDGDTPIDSVYINQKNDGGVWNMLLPSARFLGDSIKVTITHPGTDVTLCADAVRFIGNARTISGTVSTSIVKTASLENEPQVSMAVGPNPFNPIAGVSYYIPVNSNVALSVYDMNGRLVNTIVNEKNIARGRYKAVWNGRDSNGRAVSSGLYVFSLKAGNMVIQSRAALLK